MKKLFNHPLTQKTRRIVRRVVATCAVIIAVAFVTTVTVDLGPSLKGRAEKAATDYMGRPMHIGRMSVHLWLGRFVLEDIVIEGLEPDDRPFLLADRITVSMPWSTLFNRRVVFDAIEMTDWRMYVGDVPRRHPQLPAVHAPEPARPERVDDDAAVRAGVEGRVHLRGPRDAVERRHAEPRCHRRRGRTPSTAGRPASPTAPCRSRTTSRCAPTCSTTFRIVGGKVVLDRIDLTTDGAESLLTGQVDLTRWPEQLYYVRSKVNLPRMREIFFADDNFTLSGESDFNGTFHLFRETVERALAHRPRAEGKFLQRPRRRRTRTASATCAARWCGCRKAWRSPTPPRGSTAARRVSTIARRRWGSAASPRSPRSTRSTTTST